MIGEVETAGDGANDRHDYVANQRIDDRAECGANDHPDGEIDDVTAHGEFFELFKHFALPQRFRQPGPYGADTGYALFEVVGNPKRMAEGKQYMLDALPPPSQALQLAHGPI